jgi:hypothetical protein
MKKNTLSVKKHDGSAFLKAITKNIDKNAIRQNLKRSNSLLKILSTASPKSSKDLLSGIAVDLADFWDIANEHQRRVAEMSKMRFPKDKRRFENMLYELEIGLVIHAEYHAKFLKRRLSRLKKDLKLK